LRRSRPEPDIRRLPGYVGEDGEYGHSTAVDRKISTQIQAFWSAQEAVLRGNVVVYKPGEIAGPERPSEVPSSGLAGVIIVETIDHVVDEVRKINLNEAVLLAGKEL
jgi:hypothetical protein